MRLLAACGLLLALLLDAHSAPAPQPFEVTGVVVSVSRDGQTFLMVRPTRETQGFVVVLNWFRNLKREPLRPAPERRDD